MKRLLERIASDQPGLLYSGAAFLMLFAAFAAFSAFDGTEILGINRWIKPMKFASSIGIYLLTLAALLSFLDENRVAKRVIAFGTIGLLIGEMVLITMQAARGTTSHFNVAMAFDGAVFSAMGVMIAINTLLAVWLTVIYWKEPADLPPAVLTGIRLGLVLFILGSVQGGYMSAQPGHAVGGADGGPGLPFVNWSTEFGDLRAAHFFGLHSLQAVPLFGLAADRFFGRSARGLTLIFAFMYAALFIWMFARAMSGNPAVTI